MKGERKEKKYARSSSACAGPQGARMVSKPKARRERNKSTRMLMRFIYILYYIIRFSIPY
jgi:hypothetical protein